MARVLIVTGDNETRSTLRESLARYDLKSSFTSYNNGVREAIVTVKPDVLLVEMNVNQPDAEISALINRIKKRENLPVIVLVPGELLDRINLNPDTDDFIIGPYNIRELIIRINRLLRKNADEAGGEQIKSEGLTVDLATCEVTVNGRIVELTFKEYELLKLLAGNPGRVYTREVLLDKIWGYDYFGGDRTVDVHIRRLRSKIEDANHTYVETVRNIGYKFIKSE
jgi:two-component system alkaline phosphatase synthesis response regulator PhoP